MAISALSAYSQESKIITKHPQKVPRGKKWILTKQQKSLIEVGNNVFIIGNICNAQLQSNPKIISGITVLDYAEKKRYPQKRISILFNNLSKVAYTSEYTFEISDISELSVYSYSTELTETVNIVVFYEGQTIVTDACLESIQVIEKSMTEKDINDRYNVKNAKINKSKFFTGTKRFCDGLGGWLYEVTISGNNIMLKLFPDENNSYHKDKTQPVEIIKGKLEMGKINTNEPPEYLTNRFKFESGALYEMNNEGEYNEYNECK